MKRRAFDLLFGLLLVLVGVLVAEVLVRAVHPTPRRVIVREELVGTFQEVDGVVTWPDVTWPRRERSDVLEDVACDPEGAFRVMVLGDSIFNGILIPSEQVASVRLKHALQEANPGTRVCVKNLAIPGFSLYQAAAVGRAALPAFAPHVVLLELWAGAPVPPAQVGSNVYFFRGQARDALGLANPFGLPPVANRWLLGTSRLWEYLVLASPDDCPACRSDLAPHVPLLDDLLARVRDHGGELVTLMPSRLDHPFEAQPDAIFVEAAVFEPWLAEHGVRNVRTWEALAGHDAAPLAQSDVHLNAAGHALLAEVFADAVAPALARWQGEVRAAAP